MNKRFPILSIVSLILRIVGGIAVVMGLLFAIIAGIIEPLLPGHAFGQGDGREILLGIITVFSGLLWIAFGEIIGVLFAIEKNTRSTIAS